MKQENNANNQYLGICLRCRDFKALSYNEGLCWECLRELEKNETKTI